MHKVEYVLVALSKTIASATSDFVFKFALNRVDK